MSRPTPTLINLPPPPSANDTPSETPGTPNSTTTSLSALSTTAIKDGHRGAALPHHAHHSHSRSANLEAAAYRISNLAGLSVATQNPNNANNGGGGSATGYFDAAGNPVYRTKMSTVGSASATDLEAGSVEGRTTGTGTTNWDGSLLSSEHGVVGASDHRDSLVSGSEDSRSRIDSEFRESDDEGGETEGELDKMSTEAFRDGDRMDEDGPPYDSDDENRDGMSDEGNASLVGFGEGAGSTVSGPISSYNGAMREGIAGVGYRGGGSSASAMRALNASGASAGSGSPFSGTGSQQTAERIVRERLGDLGEGTLGSPDEKKPGLGKFSFEDDSKGSK